MCAETLEEISFASSARGFAANGNARALEARLKRDAADGRARIACDGYTPLHYAARNGDVTCVMMCLEHGFDVEAQTTAGHATALHKAASGGREGAIRALLSAGANARARDVDGEYALHKAAKSGDVASVMALMNAAKDVAKERDGRGRLARDVATNDATRAALDQATATI